MSLVFVLSSDGQPLDPCHPARARRLLDHGKAAVWRRYPFTIRLNARTAAASVTHPHRLKLDPGSKTTGIAVVAEASGRVVWAGELTHRGQAIRDALLSRRVSRRSRRQRKTRYRQPRFRNRRRPEGWLAPSLQHRVDTTRTWVNRLRRFVPVTAISAELVRFDTQLLENAEISGVAYQQGTLAGYEVREYILEKWGRRCAYCGAKDTPLQIEHIVPRARGGSDRISNLTLACAQCNQQKGMQTAEEFGHSDIQAQARRPLKDAAAVNTTRWALYQQLIATGMPVEVGTGGMTKFNRMRLGLEKSHWHDAACVGASTPDALDVRGVRPLLLRAMGHGTRQMCRMNAFGFPRTGPKGARVVKGFKTGDMVRAIVTTGTKQGVYVGRVAVRTVGSFNITTTTGTTQGLHHRFFRAIQRADGYNYAYEVA
ncbi:HNH endonuclease [Chloroflexales bacterium ZM16-3]|nr:HNH endonuclease [Chloroflexales bacterium ZM16-3]